MAGQVVKCPRCGEETKVVPEPDSAQASPPPVVSNSFARDAINAVRTAEDEFEGSPRTSELTMAELIDEATEDVEIDEVEEDFDARSRNDEAEADGGPVTSLRTIFAKNERLKEQTVMRSPLVLFLGGGGGLLAIVCSSSGS